jgi:hypothetical protein
MPKGYTKAVIRVLPTFTARYIFPVSREAKVEMPRKILHACSIHSKLEKGVTGGLQ